MHFMSIPLRRDIFPRQYAAATRHGSLVRHFANRYFSISDMISECLFSRATSSAVRDA
jgi:hypothetical protein